nr:MAG TPA: hypothetical protein [Caudoviricetes sp.]
MEEVLGKIALGEDKKSVIVTPEKVLPNSIYRITLTGVKDKDGKVIDPITIEYRTPYSPLYCTLYSLKLVVDTFGISDEAMLNYIRQASKEADFIAGGKAVKDGDGIPFAVEQFTRTKATYDCISRALMDRAYSGGGSEYTLDVATYKDSLNTGAYKALLDKLAKELQKWQDAIRGYYNEGRVKPRATRVGVKSSQNSDVSYTTLDTIIQDVTRDMPQWS